MHMNGRFSEVPRASTAGPEKPSRRTALKRIGLTAVGLAAGAAFTFAPREALAGYGVQGDYSDSHGYGVQGDYSDGQGYGVQGDYSDGGYGVQGDYSDSQGYGVQGDYSDGGYGVQGDYSDNN
jgi:hypothetical protein